MAIDWGSALKKAKELDEDLEKYAHKSSESERQKIASEQSAKASTPHIKKTAGDLASRITQEAKAQAVSRGIELPKTSADLRLASQLQEARSGLSDVKQQQRILSAQNNVAQRSRGYTLEDREAYRSAMRPLQQEAQAYKRDIDRIAYIDKYDTMNREDNFGGQFLASYDMGRIGQDEAMAWHEYLVSPTDENRAYAEAVSRVRENYGARNADTLSEDATLPIISQSLAGYLPQFLDQNIAGLKGAAAGAATGSVLPVAGTAAGAKIGYAAGRALYGYESMQGAAFKALIDEGVDEETARAAANDEALINSLLEGGDAAIDMLTLGIGKGITALLKQPAETAAKTTAQKVASALANYGINVASEGAQEWVQEGVSSANQRRNRTGILNLAAESAGQIGRALSGQDPETLARMNQAGVEGMKVAALMAGADAGGSAILNRRISRNNSINTAQANLSNPEYIQSGIQEAAQNAEHRINQRSITPEQNLLMYNNPLLDSVPTVEEVQSQQAGSPVYQRAMRAELPGWEQQNTASNTGAVIRDYQRAERHGEILDNESGAPLFQSEATSQGADGPLRNGTPLGEPEGSPTVSSIPPGEQNVNAQAGSTAPASAEQPRTVPSEDIAYDVYGSGRENLPETAVGANKASPWTEFVASSKEFFPEGANAARDVDVPTTDPQGRRIRKTAATAMGAKAIPDDAIADIQNMVLRGELSYNRVSDKSSIDRATKTIQDKGYQGALEEFRNSVSKGVVSKDIATLGQQLLINAANAGDGKTTAELLTLYAQMETTAGQAVQAASILRKLAPNDQLYAAQRTVSELEKTIRKNYKDIEITIDQSLIEEFGNQTTQEGRDQVLDKIYQNVADQIPSTWKDKWNAWRYLAMLGNPRTHIRNIAGNVFFQPLRIVKDRTAAAIEAGVSLASGGRLQRTKSFAANPALYKAAWNDWDNVRNVLSGNKYDDIRSEINSRRRIFRAKPLELARTGNSWLLEFEDTIFKQITYADALAGYLQANGVTAEQMQNNTVDANLMARARDYAGQEALRATYQDRNKVSDKVVQVANVLGPAGEAILPFKRTPANILVRGLEYSPAGLAKALTYDLIQVKRGNMTGAEAIDHIASGLTGSALFALGAYLFSKGIVTSGGGDDENQDRLNELTGGQNYALNLPGGGNVTLDWLAPEALPFFMGVELMDSMGQSGNTTDSIMTALKSVSDPMLELSMLQSLNDVIDSVSFSENKLGALASSAVVSYFTQAIPTLGGQFERTGEENRMSTYTDKALTIDLPGGLPEVGVPTDVQYAIGRASARIPGWDYQQIPYIDAWGREESNGPLVLRAGNNFLNPAYTSSLNVTPVDEEIQRLYTQTGDGGVVPDRPNRYITVNGERVDLSAEQYVQYATERGQMQFDMLDKLIDRSAYQRLTDSEKAAVISDVYQYADAVTKAEISDYQPDSWISKVQSSGVDPANYILYRTSLEDGMTLQDKDKAMTAAGITGNGKARLLIAENPDWADDAKEAGVTQNVFVEYKVLTSGLTGDKDAEGNTISGSKKAKVLAAINSMDIDSETKDALYYAAGYKESTIRDAPWH